MDRSRTIVITGASSGIGLATALRLATPDVNLALIARRKGPLDEVAQRCRELGANVLVLVGDMGDEADVRRMYGQVLAAYDGFVVWINNASVGVYGGFLDITSEQFQQVIRTNVMGYVHGARVALEHYRTDDQGGLLINVASVLGAVPGPYNSPYVASKYAVRGLSAALRQELRYEGLTDIRICTVLPATIDTPFYEHAGNVSGKEVRAMQPVYSADAVAVAITRLIAHPKDEVVVGAAAKLPKLLYGIAPGLAERAMARYVAHLNYRNVPAARREGNLFQSENQQARVSGGWENRTRVVVNAILATSAVFLLIGLIRKGRRR